MNNLTQKLEDLKQSLVDLKNLFVENPDFQLMSFHYYTDVYDSQAVFRIEDVQFNNMGETYEDIIDIIETNDLPIPYEKVILLDECLTDLLIDTYSTDGSDMIIDRETILKL